MVSPEKQSVISWVDAKMPEISKWHSLIWELAEPAWREYRSAAWYVKKLREEGFEVEEGSGGMPTAFCATWSNGKGPVIGGYAEYDAVPANCQKAATYKAPRDGQSPYAPGHTDPHSALGICALAGMLAAKAAMEKHNIKGTLKFLGEPAEKVRGSKPIHAAKGYYDGADAFISYHPSGFYPHTNTTVRDTHCGPSFSRIYSFVCDEPWTWAKGTGSTVDAIFPVAHTESRAPGANDALVMMYLLSRSMQASMLSFNTSWSLSEAFLVGGQATADNLPHKLSQIQYLWRTASLDDCETIGRILDQNADHVAAITHTKVTKTWVIRSRPGLPNHVMTDLTYENVKLIGAPKWRPEAKKIAREMQKNLGYEPMEEPFVPYIEQVVDPVEADRIMRRTMPEFQQYQFSDDYTEYCWHAPTVRLYTARPGLAAPKGRMNPEWPNIALGGIPATIDPMIDVTSKMIGATYMDLLTKPELLEKAWAEFKERTGGGVGGSKWIAPLLPKDFEPPVNFRWPEYVTTPRGENQWWIPVGPV